MTDAVTVARTALRECKYLDEAEAVRRLLAAAPMTEGARSAALARARSLVSGARARRSERGMLDAFLQQFGLGNEEGVALMCLAEALLRVPDAGTADRLIAEKIASGNWSEHRGQSDSLFVNAATWALMLTGKVVGLRDEITGDVDSWWKNLVARSGEPVIRQAMMQAMRIMGSEFVLGRTIEEAIARARDEADNGICSFDMLGEGARTYAQAERYFDAYAAAIAAIAADSKNGTSKSDGAGGSGSGGENGSSISVKLSALHPRYEASHQSLAMAGLLPRLKKLCLLAKESDMQLTIDAEEADRLELSLDLIEALMRDPDLDGWNGLGLALQCYSRRASALMNWLIALSGAAGRRIPVRLVKGAYWDAEVKHAQEDGLPGYPVYTRKVYTDLSYLVLARAALDHRDRLYPQFATHNAHTIAAVLEMADGTEGFEFQRLHGMGKLLYAEARRLFPGMPKVRVYAPVGAHRDLLAYLVRRLLENGANSSFVNRFLNDSVPVEVLVEDPMERAAVAGGRPHAAIPLPAKLYGEGRLNSAGEDLSDGAVITRFNGVLQTKMKPLAAGPIVSGVARTAKGADVTAPADRKRIVGTVADATAEEAARACAAASAAQGPWDDAGPERRAHILEKAADALLVRRDHFLRLLVHEAGKSWKDAVAELREAEDFLRYYAAEAREKFRPLALPGPTGEENRLQLHGRGAFVCISPWNFPLAIFIGQIAAALAAGNAVLAKPAEQTPLTGFEAVRLLHEAGVPVDALHFLPGPGETVGAALVNDPHIAGVAMTGSTETARIIHRALAAKDGPIVPLIAETGGQNAMIVDSTALPEQVVDDVIRSAFQSAGQRCSALRVLYVQEEIADGVIEMLKGAMDALTLGDPVRQDTDSGPVIDEESRDRLNAHIERMTQGGKLLHKIALPEGLPGVYVAPHMFEVPDVTVIGGEAFGPILHVIRYRPEDLSRHLQLLKATGYGLTLGIESRIGWTAAQIYEATLAGNVYVNRNMIGAVVGVQPFGGCGLSGTGPKAGGPHYLYRFATERVTTINTTASGGNAQLLGLPEDF